MFATGPMTTTQLAKRLGVSRQIVARKAQNGQIAAKKVGRGYIIGASEVHALLSGGLTAQQKRFVRATVKRIVREYGPTLEALSKC